MEVYILKCDFFCVIDDINNEFCESLDSYQEELLFFDYVGILKILKVFQNKVCVCGFFGVEFFGYELVELIFIVILEIIR